MTIPDHLINPVETRSTYPYTADGGRRWEMGTEWPDPWITIAHLAGMTERLRFLTTVYILPARTPVHVAKQVGTAAVLSGDRVELGIGMGWMEEEFDAMGVPVRQAGQARRRDARGAAQALDGRGGRAPRRALRHPAARDAAGAHRADRASTSAAPRRRPCAGPPATTAG